MFGVKGGGGDGGGWQSGGGGGAPAKIVKIIEEEGHGGGHGGGYSGGHGGGHGGGHVEEQVIKIVRVQGSCQHQIRCPVIFTIANGIETISIMWTCDSFDCDKFFSFLVIWL